MVIYKNTHFWTSVWVIHNWTGHVIFFMGNHRENFSVAKLKGFLTVYQETLASSRHCDADLEFSTQIIVELFENFIEQKIIR